MEALVALAVLAVSIMFEVSRPSTEVIRGRRRDR
jgi:hypothetical protein